MSAVLLTSFYTCIQKHTVYAKMQVYSLSSAFNVQEGLTTSWTLNSDSGVITLDTELGNHYIGLVLYKLPVIKMQIRFMLIVATIKAFSTFYLLL